MSGETIELFRAENPILLLGRFFFFVVYAIAYQAVVLGGFMFLILKDRVHPAWLFLAFVLSIRQLGPQSFGIRPWGTSA